MTNFKTICKTVVMKLQLIILCGYIYCVANGFRMHHTEGFIDELKFDKETNENSLISVYEGKRSTDENIEYKFHEPKFSNIISDDDLMVQATSSIVNKQPEDELMATTTRSKRSKYSEKINKIYDNVFDDIVSPVSNARRDELTAKATPLKKVKRNADASKVSKNKSKKSKIVNTSGELNSILSEIHSSKHHKLTRNDIRKLAKKTVMLATLKRLNSENEKNAIKKAIVIKSKHNTKERKKNIIVKKAAKKSENVEDKHVTKVSEKPTQNGNDKHMKKQNVKNEKHVRKQNEKPKPKEETKKDAVPMEKKKDAVPIEKKKDSVQDADKIKEVVTLPGNDDKTEKLSDDIAEVITNSKDARSKSEFSEDISSASKKSSLDNLSDEYVGKEATNETPNLDTKSKIPAQTSTAISTSTSRSTETIDSDTTDPFDSDKKSSIETTTSKSEDDIFSDDTLLSPTKKSDIPEKSDISELSTSTKSDLPGTKITNKINTLKSVLQKISPDKIPDKFLPDLPAGLRLIAWKELLTKKKKQLSELESTMGGEEVGGEEVGGEELAADTPVTINIDIDQDKADKSTVPANIQNTQTAVKKHTTANSEEKHPKTDHLTVSHVGYLQKHLKSARSLRKLIAKTLIGHCQTTGKRILQAFIAMDKALARAQAIATVIGRKFHVNPDRIENLVGEKEDEVVETFLRDIFTKL